MTEMLDNPVSPHVPSNYKIRSLEILLKKIVQMQIISSNNACYKLDIRWLKVLVLNRRF